MLSINEGKIRYSHSLSLLMLCISIGHSCRYSSLTLLLPHLYFLTQWTLWLENYTFLVLGYLTFQIFLKETTQTWTDQRKTRASATDITSYSIFLSKSEFSHLPVQRVLFSPQFSNSFDYSYQSSLNKSLPKISSRMFIPLYHFHFVPLCSNSQPLLKHCRKVEGRTPYNWTPSFLIENYLEDHIFRQKNLEKLCFEKFTRKKKFLARFKYHASF